MPKRKPPTILALDPGLRELGFAVLSGRRLEASGVHALRLLPPEKRLPETRRLIRAWIEAYQPTSLVIERTQRHPVKWLDAVHRLARSSRRVARGRHVSVAAYAPQTVRKSVTGDGWASKRELAEAVVLKFPALRVYLTADRRWKERYWLNMFDAVGLALHHQTVTA
ncbi:MAG: crossover junction endodeoxyribonuclease RuvC [Candidatus Eisenbacteria bacterium]|nr:crossover junction endodeoxyribonuclease RuvC [Candidatus Eisenbacteria bacterium]MBU1947878.1 crossover junction endodeoxyribonuclease RuvC [Candidatus Eisenbacteria bacterium]